MQENERQLMKQVMKRLPLICWMMMMDLVTLMTSILTIGSGKE